MAIVHPEGWREMQASGAAQREIETLAVLAEGLSDDYTIFHGVHWTRVRQGGHAIVGEIDFAIVGPTGKLLLIEQKSGFLAETPEGLVKRYMKKEKSVPIQMARSADALAARLRKVCGDEPVAVEALLYCPDYTVKSPGSAGIDPARIVDASKRQHLVHVVRSILPAEGLTREQQGQPEQEIPGEELDGIGDGRPHETGTRHRSAHGQLEQVHANRGAGEHHGEQEREPGG